LLGTLAVWGWRRFRAAAAADRPTVAAAMAGLAALLAQLLFDDLTGWMAVMVPAVFLLAWVAAAQPGPAAVYPRISLGWVAHPALILLACSGVALWAYQPFHNWLPAVQAGNWREAAEFASQSAERDPAFHFYHTEAGLLWAWEWQYRRDPAALAESRRHFNAALQLEPSPSWTWANLAMMDAAAGELPAAIEHMQRAIQLNPGFAPYSLNLGKFYEQSGSFDLAKAAYRRALELNPAWVTAAFWKATPLRSLITFNAPAWTPAAPAGGTYTRQARAQADAGSLAAADRLLTQAALLNEPGLDIARVRLLLAEKRGSTAEAQALRAQIDALLAQDGMMLDVFVTFTYPAYMSNRDGLGFTAAPGLIPQMNP
jgi:tetratricopeptide (TPR) repeat protein